MAVRDSHERSLTIKYMKQKICLLVIGVLLISSFSTTDTAEAENSCATPVFFSEIGWAGSSKGAADEWLELANAGETEFNLTGWIIEGAGTNNSALSLPEGVIISPRSTYLVANYSAESDKSSLATPPNYVNTAISLSNSTIHLILKDQNGCLIDEAGDGGAPFFGGTGTEGTVSMIRLEPIIQGALPTAWTASETSNGFDNSIDLGTPGTISWVNVLSSSVEQIVEETIPLPEPLPEDEGEAVEVIEEVIPETTEPTVTEEIIETEIIPSAQEQPEEIEAEGEGELEEIIEEAELEEVSDQTVISYSVGELLINEFVSDPVSGEKEWVEVINPNNKNLSLVGWKVSDESGRTVPLPEVELGYGQVAVAEFSSSTLKNNGDKIKIIAPDETVIHEIEYGTASIPTTTDPYSVARGADDNFVVTETPTKGKMNIITTTVTITKTTTCEVSVDEEDEVDEEVSSTEIIEETALPNIRLSELYPNTDGADATDEFIELENYGSETIDLFGLTLKDAAENDWSFTDHTELAAGKFLVISRTEYQFALNNSGSETVTLYSTGGTLLDQIQYENAPKKSTYARDGNIWRWTSIVTPNEPNRFSETVESEDNGLVRQASTDINNERVDASESTVSVTIAEARGLAKDTKVTVEGIVAVSPGIFGRQIFYLSDNVAGIQIYKSDGNFPELLVGDLVELGGTISSNRGEPRIKLNQTGEILVVAGETVLDITDRKIVTEAEAGQLIRLAGMVTEKSSDRFTMETSGGLSEIRIKENTGISLSELKPGSQITVTGIVGQSEENYFLLPRSVDDLVIAVAVAAVESTVPTEPTGKQTAETANQKNAIYIGSAVIVGLIIYAVSKRRGHKTKSYEKTNKFSFAPTG
jgi:hypothetical protein